MASRAASPLRIAIGLSGGVDSAVAALLLRRCVHTTDDVAALRRFGATGSPPPALATLQAAVATETPLSHLLPASVRLEVCAGRRGSDGRSAQTVVYHPFFMRNWHDHDAPHGWCSRSQRDYDDAQSVARFLGLLPPTASLPVLDFAEEYARTCFQRMLHAYAAGHTLNVDVLCNTHIKFGAVAQALQVVPSPALSEGVGRRTLLATGHYARTWCVSRDVALLQPPCSAGRDLNDQTHFLSRVPPTTLARVIFPLGHLVTAKADVRTMADAVFSADGAVARIARKQTSTGICFVGPPSPAEKAKTARPPSSPCGARFANFLNAFLRPPPPPPLSSPRHHRTVFREATTGTEMVLADGDALFGGLRADYPAYLPAYAVTLGQRLRLADSHGAPIANYYVARKVCLPAPPSEDPHVVRLLAEVHVVDRWDHPLLWTPHLRVASLRWWLPTSALQRASSWRCRSGGQADGGTTYAVSCCCALRHQMTPQPATLRWTHATEAEGGARVRRCTVDFDAAVRAPAAGQALVVYATLSEVRRMLGLPGMETAADELVVIGSGWVDLVEEEE